MRSPSFATLLLLPVIHISLGSQSSALAAEVVRQASPPPSTDDFDSSAVVLPIDGLLPSRAERELLWDAQQVVIGQCMAERGFEWDAVSYDSYLLTLNQGLLATTIEEAAEFGYTPISVEAPPPSPNDARASDTPGFTDALAGGDGGCAQLALDTFRPEDGVYYALEESLVAASIEAQQVAEGSPEIQAKTAEWSDCMSAQGYSLASPAEAIDVMASQPNDERNRNTRVADLTCQDTTGYQLAFLEMRASIEQEWIEEHPEAVRQYSAAKTEMLELVAEVLSAR